MRRKENLARALDIQKGKLRVTIHFSEIIKLQFEKKNAINCFVLYMVKGYFWLSKSNAVCSSAQTAK